MVKFQDINNIIKLNHMKKDRKKMKNEATTVACFTVFSRLYGAIRGFARTVPARFGVVAVICMALFVTCGKENTDRPNEEEFTINVGQSGNWTPFSGKTDVTFTNSNNSVLIIVPSGSTVTFTGLKEGKSTITAAFGDKLAFANVTVKDGGGEENPGGTTDPPFPPDPGNIEVIETNAYYSGTIKTEYDYLNELLPPEYGKSTTTEKEFIDFIYKAEVTIFVGLWKSILNDTADNDDLWWPIVATKGHLISDGYISAKYHYHDIYESNNVYPIVQTSIDASIECSESNNPFYIFVYYNKYRNKYRMKINTWIISTTCPYQSTQKYSHGTDVPWSSRVGVNIFGPAIYENNFDNDGNLLDSSEFLYFDLIQSDVDGLMKVSQTNEWTIKIAASGELDHTKESSDPELKTKIHKIQLNADVLIGK